MGFRVCVFLCVHVCGCVGVSAALSAMLEWIELENCGRSSVQEAELQEEPEEMSEETLNRFNLSLEDKTSR